MNRTPAAMRWMVEKRGTLAGELERLDALATELAVERLTRCEELAALDETIRLFDGRLDPTTIGAVRRWAGRYSKRGALKETAAGLLQAAYPQPVTTMELVLRVCAVLKLDFDDSAAYRRWVDDSLAAHVMRKLLGTPHHVRRMFSKSPHDWYTFNIASLKEANSAKYASRHERPTLALAGRQLAHPAL
jgi:hypothetical protein